MWCCRPAPNIGGGEAVHVDGHIEEVVRLQEQVSRVLHIEEHRGCSGAVLVPEDEERTDRNIQTVANGHLQVTSPVSV